MTEENTSTSPGWNGAPWGDNKGGLRPRVCPSLCSPPPARPEGRLSFPLQQTWRMAALHPACILHQDFLDFGRQNFVMSPYGHFSQKPLCVLFSSASPPTARRRNHAAGLTRGVRTCLHAVPHRARRRCRTGPSAPRAVPDTSDTAHSFLLDSTTLWGF